METSISRRSFVAGAAALGAAAAVGASAATAFADEADSVATADQECDVLVIGGGITGSIAALAALSAGVENVTLVEKQFYIGGSAALSSAYMVTVENDNFGDDVDDSWETTRDYLMSIHSLSPDTQHPDIEHLTYIFSEQSATIDFMLSLGMTAEFITKSTAVTAWEGEGEGMMASLATIMDELGVNVLLSTPALELTTDEDGAVTGAIVENDEDGQFTITAKKTILACGGASHNDEILTKYMPTFATIDFDNKAAAGDTGDGFTMAEAVGAKLYDSMVFAGAGVSVDSDWKSATSVRLSTSSQLLVDAEGVRFMSENPAASGGSQILTYNFVEHGSPAYYFIYNATDDTLEALQTGIEMGCVFYGDTPEELAEAAGLDVETFTATFEAYQAACEAGVDEEFGKDADNLVAYDLDAGLYAVYYRAASWGTIGGVVVDSGCRVWGTNGKIIENLFAGGEMSNRDLFSDFYIGGNSLATSSTRGRIAGETAAAEILG